MAGKSQSTRVKLPQSLKYGSNLALTGAEGLYQSQAPLPSTYVGISPLRERGLGMAEQIAGGNQVPSAALDEYLKTIRGGYLSPDSNPYLREIVSRAGQEALNPIASGFANAGRFGGGAYANAAADALSGTAARLYGGQYDAERARMLQALGQAPVFDELQYAGASHLAGVGREREADQLARQQESVRQYLFPYQKQGLFEQSLTGNPLASGTQKTSSPFDWTAAGAAILQGLTSPSVGGGK